MSTRDGDSLSEYRVWLTRRFVRVFWNVLGRVLEADATMDSRVAPDSRHAVMQFQQEAALARTNFSTSYAARGAHTPLGAAPLLVTKIQVRKGPEGKKILSMHAASGQGINIGLNPQLIYSMRKLLADAVKKAEWNLPLSLFSEAAMPETRPSHKVN